MQIIGVASATAPGVAWHQALAACAGAADGSLKVWDKRKLTQEGGHALFTFNYHTGPVLRAEWSPSAPGETPRWVAEKH